MDTRSAAPILGDTAASRAARLNTRRARRRCAAAARPFIAFPGDFIEVSPPVIYFVVNRSKSFSAASSPLCIQTEISTPRTHYPRVRESDIGVGTAPRVGRVLDGRLDTGEASAYGLGCGRIAAEPSRPRSWKAARGRCLPSP